MNTAEVARQDSTMPGVIGFVSTAAMETMVEAALAGMMEIPVRISFRAGVTTTVQGVNIVEEDSVVKMERAET